LFVLLLLTLMRPIARDAHGADIVKPSPAPEAPERTVKQAHALLSGSPAAMLGKTLHLKAYVLEQLQVRTVNPQVTRCANHLLLVDHDRAVIDRFRRLRWSERPEFLERLPHVKTSEYTPGSAGAVADMRSRHAVFRGRFVRTSCTEDAIRFHLESTVRDIPEHVTWPRLESTVTTGMVIARGRPLLPPLAIRSLNGSLTVNGVTYRPRPARPRQEHENQATRDFERLVALLRRGGTLVFGGANEHSTPRTIEAGRIDVGRVTAILRSERPRDAVKTELMAILGVTTLDDALFDELVARWPHR
jgi:hypothetical protein